MHQIVDLAIADVPAGVDGQVLDDRELRESKGRFLALPEGAIAVRPQLQIPEMAAGHAGHCTGGTFRIDGKLNALEDRSEEHTSELQSLMRISYAVFCLK